MLHKLKVKIVLKQKCRIPDAAEVDSHIAYLLVCNKGELCIVQMLDYVKQLYSYSQYSRNFNSDFEYGCHVLYKLTTLLIETGFVSL